MAQTQPPTASHTDVILAMQEPYVRQIVDGSKTYEFRKYHLEPSVKRIWFYVTAPTSSITHICEIEPARTRNTGDAPLEEDGLGNSEFNARHEDWEGYDFAYKILSVHALEEPISLADLNEKYDLKSAPRKIVYLPESPLADVDWQKQLKIR